MNTPSTPVFTKTFSYPWSIRVVGTRLTKFPTVRLLKNDITVAAFGFTDAASEVEAKEKAWQWTLVESGTEPASTSVPNDLELSWQSLIEKGVKAGKKAMTKYPQPNYVITKFAEESGEVVKDCIHVLEGRQSMDNLEKEMVQTIGMMYRLWVEGDQVHGLLPVSPVLTKREEE